MYLLCPVLAQYLSLVNDYIYRLDISVYTLLAIGYFGIGIISFCMVDYASFQAAWYCSGRSVQSYKIYYYVTFQADKTRLNFISINFNTGLLLLFCF